MNKIKSILLWPIWWIRIKIQNYRISRMKPFPDEFDIEDFIKHEGEK